MRSCCPGSCGVMLVCVRWYAAYPLSLRHIEEMMAERGASIIPVISSSASARVTSDGLLRQNRLSNCVSAGKSLSLPRSVIDPSRISL